MAKPSGGSVPFGVQSCLTCSVVLFAVLLAAMLVMVIIRLGPKF